jgi:DNA-binding MarR family transcriptional regulator
MAATEHSSVTSGDAPAVAAGDATAVAAGDRLDSRELRAWRGMLRVHATLTKALDAEMEARHGLPLTSYEVLMHLAEADGERMRMCDLASSILLSRSGLTRLVDRLEREGLLVRESCASDARGAFARLTPLGRDKLGAARRTHLAGVRTLFLDRLEPGEQELLGTLWERALPGAAAGGQHPGPTCG